MKRFIKRIIFEITFSLYKSRLSTIKGIFTYPLIVSMTFNKKEYFERYINGESLKDQIEKEIDNISNRSIKAFKRSLYKVDKEYSEEVIDRYERLQRRNENKIDMKEAEKELELLLNKTK